MASTVFRVIGVRILNSLPDHIRLEPDLKLFKAKQGGALKDITPALDELSPKISALKIICLMRWWSNVALTEKIVIVLPRMGCPHRIEPHQIQGLDFIHIFPVIQWLVKQSVAVREERRDFLRESAVREFDRQHGKAGINAAHALKLLLQSQEDYRPRRVLRRKEKAPEDEIKDVESTLMEYGLVDVASTLSDGSAATSESTDSFCRTVEPEHTTPTRLVGAIVSTQSQAIAAVSEEFTGLSLDVEDKDSLLVHKEQLLQEVRQLEDQVTTKTEKLKKTRETLQTFRTQGNDPETNNNVRLYSKLQELLLLEESLKIQEQEFREHCRSELSRLQQQLKEARERSSAETEDADAVCEAERNRVANLRLLIARRNRAIAQLQRRLDDVPGRAELAQYQRRFLELYGLVSQKHAETKQFYTMYNTLDDTRLYLTKELNLLNSVQDTYSEAMSNAANKALFMKQFEASVTAIKANKAKVEARRNEEKLKKEKLSQQLMDLVEQQRQYVSVVRQLKIEVKRNEALLANLRALSTGSGTAT